VARGISKNIFETQGSSSKFVDCELIVKKGRGLNEKVAGIFGFLNYFLIGNGTTGSLIWLILSLERRRGGGAPVADPRLGKAVAWAQ
jgi:hypothetical protein